MNVCMILLFYSCPLHIFQWKPNYLQTTSTIQHKARTRRWPFDHLYTPSGQKERKKDSIQITRSMNLSFQRTAYKSHVVRICYFKCELCYKHTMLWPLHCSNASYTPHTHTYSLHTLTRHNDTPHKHTAHMYSLRTHPSWHSYTPHTPVMTHLHST